MIIRIIMMIVIAAALVPTDVTGSDATVSSVRFEQHHVHIRLDVPARSAQISDEGTVQIAAGWNFLYLSQAAVIDSFVIDDRELEYIVVVLADTSGLPPSIRDGLPALEVEGEPQLVFFQDSSAVRNPFLTEQGS